jgi:hypothetical protein
MPASVAQSTCPRLGHDYCRSFRSLTGLLNEWSEEKVGALVSQATILQGSLQQAFKMLTFITYYFIALVT